MFVYGLRTRNMDCPRLLNMYKDKDQIRILMMTTVQMKTVN